MNHRPKLRRPALLLPNIPGHDEELWEVLMQLARVKSLQEWSLIGGQMVLLLSLVKDPGELATGLTRKDRMRLLGVHQLKSPDHSVWRQLDEESSLIAKHAYQTLVRTP